MRWRSDRNKWEANITVDGKTRYLGRFIEEADAVAAHAKAAAAIAQGQPPVLPPARKQPSSKHRGVYKPKAGTKWVAKIVKDGATISLGSYRTEAGAAKAYTEAVVLLAQGKPLPERPRRESSSRHKGVYWDKKSGKWKATITVDGKIRQLGMFKQELKAAEAYTIATFWQENPKPTSESAASAAPESERHLRKRKKQEKRERKEKRYKDRPIVLDTANADG